MRKGFTLMEMSIVLVIIGLLTAAIIVGQSLVRSSNIQTIISDVAGFKTAITQFQQKYNAVPGDMSNAQSYWGANPNCIVVNGTGTGTQTCNGNGNGHTDEGATPPYEQFLVWQHLANGGFISGQYTGTSVNSPEGCAPFVNCPGGKVNQGQAYFLKYSTGGWGTNTTNFWVQGPGHYMSVGATKNPSGNTPLYPLLTTAEAYSLDSKVDDGLPGMGAWKSIETGHSNLIPNCVVTRGTTTMPTDGTLASEPTSVYYVAYGTTPACSFEIYMGP